MKKILLLLISLAIIFDVSVCAFAAEKTEISLKKISSNDGKIIVEVDLSESGDPCMLQFCVSYDSEVLDCVSAVSGGAFSGISDPVINKTDGKIFLIWDALKPLEEGGTVLRLEFVQKSEGKSTSVKIDESEEFIIANSDFEEIGLIKGSLEFVTEGTSGGEKKPENESSSGSSSVNSSASVPEANTSSENSADNVTEKEPHEENISEEENIDEEISEKSSSAETKENEETLSEAESETVSDESKQSSEVIEVHSPGGKNEERTPALIWVLIIALAVCAAVMVFFVVTKIKNKTKNC